MLLVSRCRRFNERDGPSRLLTEPGRRPVATLAVWSALFPGCQIRNEPSAACRASNKNPHGLKALGAWGTAKRILNCWM
jgi:hypothetical protein